MSLNEQKKEVINSINIWRELVSEIELSDKNISDILKCLDFNYMYKAVNELKIVNGYLFSDENKPYFLDTVNNLTENESLIKEERQRLKELLSFSPDKYLEYLLIPVKEKIHKRNEVFTKEHESMFYQIMNTVSQINIDAIKKFKQLSV